MLRQITILIGESIFILPLVLIGKFVVHNALIEEFQLAFHGEIVHQIAILDGLRQLVAIGGHATFQIEHIIGVLVDLILRGCGEAYQRRIEIIKDVPILIVDGAVRLIADDQIKMPAGEQLALIVPDGIDAVHHGLIGGEDAVGGIVVLFFAQIGDGEIRQQVDKAALGLRDQTVAVGKEEDVFDPAMLQKHIAQGDTGTGLAAAGGHDQQRLAAVLLIESLADGLDGPLLIIPARNGGVHRHIAQAHAHTAQIEQLFQIPFGIDGGHPALRVLPVVDIGIKAVGQENDRTATILFFQNIRIELGLLAALGGIHAHALGLDDGKGTLHIIIEHIIRIAHFAFVGHAGELHLTQPVASLHPACIDEHGIDIDLAGLVFGQIQRLGHIGGLLGLAAGGEFFPEGGVLRHQLLQLDLGGVIHHGHRLGRLIQQGVIKGMLLIAVAVAVGHKIQEAMEIFQTQRGLLPADGAAVVRCLIAQQAHQLHALMHILPHHIPEVLVIHQGLQAIIPRQHKRAVHGVHPFDGEFHGPAAVDDRRRRIDGEDLFRCHRHLGEGLKGGGGFKESEVGHGYMFPSVYVYLTPYKESPSIPVPFAARTVQWLSAAWQAGYSSYAG